MSYYRLVGIVIPNVTVKSSFLTKSPLRNLRRHTVTQSESLLSVQNQGEIPVSEGSEKVLGRVLLLPCCAGCLVESSGEMNGLEDCGYDVQSDACSVLSANRPEITPRPALMNLSGVGSIFGSQGYVTSTCDPSLLSV